MLVTVLLCWLQCYYVGYSVVMFVTANVKSTSTCNTSTSTTTKLDYTVFKPMMK